MSEKNIVNLGLVNSEGELNKEGYAVLDELLRKLPPVHKKKWGKVFVSLMEKNVPAGVELVIVRDKRVLLTHRDDEFFTGWHLPGTYIGPRESIDETALRCAIIELNTKVKIVRPLGFINKLKSPRFHDFILVLLCSLDGPKPSDEKWFSEKPDDLLKEYDIFWPRIEKLL